MCSPFPSPPPQHFVPPLPDAKAGDVVRVPLPKRNSFREKFRRQPPLAQFGLCMAFVGGGAIALTVAGTLAYLLFTAPFPLGVFGLFLAMAFGGFALFVANEKW